MPALKNIRHERFCHAIVSKKYDTNHEAYIATVGAGKYSADADSKAATLLVPGTAVSNRIAEIRAEIAARLVEDRANMEATFLSIEEKRRFLARVVRCNYTTIAATIIKDADGEAKIGAPAFDFEKDGDLIQGIKQTKYGIEYVMHDKLKAIQLDNDFPGGGGVPDSAAKLLERLIRPGIPADRTPLMLDLDSKVIEMEVETSEVRSGENDADLD